MGYEGDVNTNFNWNNPPRHPRGVGNPWKSGDHQNYIVEIGHNTERSPGDLIRLAIIPNSLRDHRLTQV